MLVRQNYLSPEFDFCSDFGHYFRSVGKSKKWYVCRKKTAETCPQEVGISWTRLFPIPSPAATPMTLSHANGFEGLRTYSYLVWRVQLFPVLDKCSSNYACLLICLFPNVSLNKFSPSIVVYNFKLLGTGNC